MPNNSIDSVMLLPEPQQRNISVALILMILSLVTCFYCLHKDNYSKTISEVFYFWIMSMTIFVGLEFYNRFYYFFDGCIKINSEHEGSFWRVIRASFSFNIPSAVIVTSIIVFSLIFTRFFHTGQTSFSFCTVNNKGFLVFQKNYITLIMAFFSALSFSNLLLNVVNINECRAHKIHVFNQLGGLDYGSSMACSYFYGYLKIILPSDGRENLGLLGRIEAFEADQGVKVPVKKFFILIPASFYTPPNLRDSSKSWFEAIPNRLSYLKLDRAGVAQREYKNTVYKIHPGGLGSGKKPVHVVTEGATPLLTFYEVQKHKHKFSDTYTEYKREIGKSFYRTLQQLLKDNPDCRDVCELVYYEDYDENGELLNPAEILLRRIQEEMCNDLSQ